MATMGRRADVRGWTEIDLRPGEDGDRLPDGLLDSIAARVGETGMRPGAPGGAAELDRMLRPAPRRRVGRKGSAGAVLMDYVGRQVDRIGAEELRVRRDAPDAVHQMRIATRRLRSALTAYRNVLDRERTDPVASALRELGRAPRPGARRRGAARDHRRRARRAPVRAAAGPRAGRGHPTLRPRRVRGAGRGVGRAGQPRAPRAARRPRRPPGTSAAEPQRPSSGGEGAAGPQHRPPRAARDVRRARRGRRHRAAHRPQSRQAAALRAGGDRRASPRVEEPAAGVGRPPGRGCRPAGAARAGAAAENGFSFGVLWGRAEDRAAAIEAELPALWRRARAKLG